MTSNQKMNAIIEAAELCGRGWYTSTEDLPEEMRHEADDLAYVLAADPHTVAAMARELQEARELIKRSYEELRLYMSSGGSDLLIEVAARLKNAQKVIK